MTNFDDSQFYNTIPSNLPGKREKTTSCPVSFFSGEIAGNINKEEQNLLHYVKKHSGVLSDIADDLGVPIHLLKQYLSKHPALIEYVQDERIRSVDNAEKVIFKCLKHKIDYNDPNMERSKEFQVSLAKWYLKNHAQDRGYNFEIQKAILQNKTPDQKTINNNLTKVEINMSAIEEQAKKIQTFYENL
jgi:hypothetical protein